MKRILINLLPAVLLISVIPCSAPAIVEWDIQRTLNLDAAPLDMAVALNGKWIFVLTDRGFIHIYSAGGVLADKIEIGRQIDQIKVGPREDILLLKSTRDKTVQVLMLDFVQQIDTTGSPFKGPEGAPVTIAVFSEFQ